MQTEQIDFTFILTTYGVVDYIPVAVLVNGEVLHSEHLTSNGRQLVTVRATLNQGPAHIAISVTENKPGAARLENVKVAWIADNSGLNSAWINRANNEIWNYDDAETEAAFERMANGPNTKVITLDYNTDDTVPSYLRNYAIVVDQAGQRVLSRSRKGQHVFNEAGSFIIPMTSPISYWLMERLFKSI
jgi:hypothetical protein